MSGTNPLIWWPPGTDRVPASAAGFRTMAVGVAATNYQASKAIYDALFEAAGLPVPQDDPEHPADATNYAGVLVLSPAQDDQPTQGASIIIFVGSSGTVDTAHSAAEEAGAEPYSGGEGTPPSQYYWKALTHGGNAIYIVAEETNTV